MLDPSIQASPYIVGQVRRGNRALTVAKGTLAVASRHKRIAWLGSIVSLVAAVAVGFKFSTTSWDASGVMIYAPLTGPDTQGSLYVPPDLKTLVTLAKTPANLRAIRDEFKLQVPLTVLEKSFKVTVPSGTKTVEFELRWSGAKMSADMVNRLMDLFRNQVAAVRKDKINGYVEDFHHHVEECRSLVQAANEALSEFENREHVGDVASDLARNNGEVDNLETELGKVRREGANFETQLKALDDHMRGLKDEDRKREEDEKKSEAVEETVADNRRRQERLRELIVEERLKLEINAKLVARRAEMQRQGKLLEKNHASREDYERARSEVLTLESQINETEKIAIWKAELERIDKVIVPKGASKNQGSTAIQQIVFKRLELQLFIIAAKKGAEQLEAGIAAHKREAIRLMGLQSRHRSLARAVESCDAERLAASAELTALKKLQAINTFEFAIITPATPGPYPAASNRKILIGGVALGGTLLTLGLLALGDVIGGRKLEAGEAAWKLGLTILSRVPSEVDPSPWNSLERREDPALRLLALRIRQASAEPGALVLFSTLNEDRGSAWLVSTLARCFARRDERVLIMDLAGHATDRPAWSSLRPPWSEAGDRGDELTGLHAYLAFECDDPDDFITPTLVPGVDCMPAGELLFGMELIATHRMNDLIALMRERYTLILAVGPQADQQVDLEMLSAHASGVIFHAIEGEALLPLDTAGIRHLGALGAPVLGLVLGEPSRRSPSPRILEGAVRPQLGHA